MFAGRDDLQNSQPGLLTCILFVVERWKNYLKAQENFAQPFCFSFIALNFFQFVSGFCRKHL